MTQFIGLGYLATDNITGFTGTITGYVEYLTGCNQALIVPKVGPDGAYREPLWFDIQRLTIHLSLPKAQVENGTNPGSDKPAPRR